MCKKIDHLTYCHNVRVLGINIEEVSFVNLRVTIRNAVSRNNGVEAA